ncbi:MAG: hypothetical protein AUK47_13455 [Deltaproteobacteria bacterium CG2_30_63_29]|nr:MAG: hypothetical protein AUK47_13455 [Deltaproteobacteria bacterium CG2_30_63_29]
MPRPRFFKLEPDKQARIIDGAGQVFALHGYQGASLNQIIAQTDISKGAFYYYFDDKADLFATCVTHALEEVFQSVDFDPQTLTVETFWPALMAMNDRMMTYTNDHPWLVAVGKQLYTSVDDPELKDRLAPLLAHGRSLWAAILVRGQEIGQVRNDLPLELLLAVMNALDVAIDRWFVESWHDYSREELERLTTVALDMIRRMVEAPEA